MDNVFSKIVSIFIAAIIMIMIPMTYYRYYQKQVIREYISVELQTFVDNVRNTGIISSEVYEQFRGKVYDVLPRCSIEIQNSKEKGSGAESYTDCYYSPQIEKQMEKNGAYYFEYNDIIRMQIVTCDGELFAYYGGMVKDEAY